MFHVLLCTDKFLCNSLIHRYIFIVSIVEDPSEDFQRLRDFIDVRNCMKLDIFSSANLEKGFTKDLVKECQGKLKINKVNTKNYCLVMKSVHNNLMAVYLNI